MYEIFQNFEQTALRFSPIVLIVPGLLAVLVGLFIWLGGLGLSKVLVALLGAVTGFGCGFFIIKDIMAACVLTAAVALIALVLQRFFIAILAVFLALVLTFFVFTGICPEVIKATENVPVTTANITDDNVVIGARHTPEVLKAYLVDFSNMVKQAAWHMRTYVWPIMAALAVIVLAAGLFLRRLMSALCCAVLGTMLIFAGMILLLLYKGSVPISGICNKSLFYAGVFGAMTAFGTVVQLLLCPRLEKSAKRKKEVESDTSEKKKHSWRTS
jgi:hypothetical protein